MKASVEKRALLVETAANLAHSQGFHRTTLADIAHDSGVPLGNVYYYFRTKEALGEALIDALVNRYTALTQAWDKAVDPRARLLAFIQTTVANREMLASSGCPIGTLCTELHKEGGALADRAARLFELLLDWLEVQLRELGQGARSREDAAHLLGALQGASLLTHTFHDSRYLLREAARQKEWVNALPSRSSRGKSKEQS